MHVPADVYRDRRVSIAVSKTWASEDWIAPPYFVRRQRMAVRTATPAAMTSSARVQPLPTAVVGGPASVRGPFTTVQGFVTFLNPGADGRM